LKLREHLVSYTVGRLKPLASLCGCGSVTRKDDLIACIAQRILIPEGQRQQWERMDELARHALAQAVHSDGRFDPVIFQARYGQQPPRPKSGSYWKPISIPLDLFIYDGVIPDDLLAGLESWAPRPEPFKLAGQADAPATVQQGGYQYELLRVDTEQIGQQDLAAFLRLVDQGGVRVSATTGQPTAAAIQKILGVLAQGDFAEMPDGAGARQVIRPIGLVMFAVGGGLAEVPRGATSSVLSLTEAGREWLRRQAPELLLAAFERWVASDRFDEIKRVSALRGLNSPHTHLTPPSVRRERITEALSWCPAGVWISVEDLFRAIKIWQLDFDVEVDNAGNLYVGAGGYYRDYSWGGRDGYWRVVKGLYILAVLWELLAAIGAVDVLYLPPEDAKYTAEVYTFDDLYYSLYDGLSYFRINDLGAYLLGQHEHYGPPLQARQAFLSVDDDLVAHITAVELVTQADLMLLEAVATPLADHGYRFDLPRLLDALEAGRDLEDAVHHLAEWHVGPLPAALPALFADAQSRGQAFAAPVAALTIEVRDAELVQFALEDSKLKRICKLAGERTLVIPRNRERAFRSRLRELGYVVPNG